MLKLFVLCMFFAATAFFAWLAVADIKRRRAMTPEQRAAEDADLAPPVSGF